MYYTFLNFSRSCTSCTLSICCASCSDIPVKVLALTVFDPSLPASAAALLVAALANVLVKI